MAVLNIPNKNIKMTDTTEISKFLSQYSIWYRYFAEIEEIPQDASDEEVLQIFATPITELKKQGGYTTADVINITPDIESLQVMLDKFNKEHWHDEDEVRFIVEGRGLFHINPGNNDEVFSIEMTKGDMINVPRGTYHWFDLCKEQRVRAIRLFQQKSGWTPHYTNSQEDQKFQPLCFGPEYIANN